MTFPCSFDSESDSDSSGSIWSRGISTPFTTHQIQAVFLLHSRHVDPCQSPDVFTLELVEDPEGTWSVKRWKKVFEESLSFASFLLAHNILFTYMPVLLLVILYLIIFIILQMSIAIVTVFVLCWLPFSTNHLIIVSGQFCTFLV